jgi:hypothetical protein
MALTTGTGLTNPSDVIDSMRAHLATDGWTTVINNGTVGSNDKEIWMNLPAASTFYGDYDFTIGLKADGADKVQMTGTFYTPSEALLTGISPRSAFAKVLGQPNLNYNTISDGLARQPGTIGDTLPSGQVLTGTQNGEPVETDLFNQGASYLDHWIFTPNNSPLGFSEQYCYMVVEVATGVYRTFGFGEGIKLGASGWTGGMFLDGSNVRTGAADLSRYFAGGDSNYNGFTDDGERAYVLNFDNDNYLNDGSSPATWNPWVHLSDPWADDWVCGWGMGGRRGLGEDYIDRSTAAFSGQTIRMPSRIYAMNLRQGAGANRMRPLIEYPDVFHMNIANFTPGETIVDDAESFLVVPYVSKTGTDNSGNFGFLIRHPSL